MTAWRRELGGKAALKLGYWAEAPLTSREIEFDTSEEQVLVYFPQNKMAVAKALAKAAATAAA